jgi:hypothetical protein
MGIVRAEGGRRHHRRRRSWGADAKTGTSSGKCTCGKLSYPNRDSAKAAAYHLRMDGHKPQRPYKACRGVWHLTTKEEQDEG